MERSDLLWQAIQRGARTLDNANLCDVLSTHLEWMTRQGTLNSDEVEKTRRVVKKLCLAGMECIGGHKAGAHTLALLYLTSARVCIDEKIDPWGTLHTVERATRGITDPMQKARVYAKLGYLHRKNWEFLKGYYWGIKALLVPGITRFSRLKCAALLIGYDR
jgi:hypothetical protein